MIFQKIYLLARWANVDYPNLSRGKLLGLGIYTHLFNGQEYDLDNGQEYQNVKVNDQFK